MRGQKIKLNVQFGSFQPEGDGAILCDTFMLIGGILDEEEKEGKIFVVAKDGKEEADGSIMFIFLINMAHWLMHQEIDQLFKDALKRFIQDGLQRISERNEKGRKWLPSERSSFGNN